MFNGGDGPYKSITRSNIREYLLGHGGNRTRSLLSREPKGASIFVVVATRETCVVLTLVSNLDTEEKKEVKDIVEEKRLEFLKKEKKENPTWARMPISTNYPESEE